MKQKVESKRGKNVPAGIGIATLSGIATMLIGAFVLTWLLAKQTIQEDTMRYGVMIISILSAVVASSTAIHQTNRYILPVSAGTCLCILIVLLGTNALFFDGNYDGVGATMLVILGTGIAVAMIATKLLNQPKTYHKKR